ncbi:MAG: hypothetical protein LHW57_00735 [Candidatus Cloacimonetes bacterium]|nr:hypothetical protein [Candidatus Cloacimonadota bacterium]
MFNFIRFLLCRIEHFFSLNCIPLKSGDIVNPFFFKPRFSVLLGPGQFRRELGNPGKRAGALLDAVEYYTSGKLRGKRMGEERWWVILDSNQ